MSADHEECPPPPSIPLLPPPPPCSQFEAYGFGRWSRKEWGAAEAASGLFPEPYKSRLLSLCSCNKGPEAARCFVLAYQNAYALITNATVISSSLWASSPVAVGVSAAPASTLPMTIWQLSSLNLPPLEILKICIDSTMTGKNIVFPLGERWNHQYLVLHCVVRVCTHF
ncbi:Hypothetical protein, putative [Bodo saltans]|uniref:Uncharacterized protein n=1 Tax=Bodo saltans TaxID=75058 RepID=A0A0S4JYN8_BODSA|nr:Hypothetical protein, putative [Bodo saltans]|eukprot:CUG93709.1 Hypothetical protein, putative [Bodo saltans]